MDPRHAQSVKAAGIHFSETKRGAACPKPRLPLLTMDRLLDRHWGATSCIKIVRAVGSDPAILNGGCDFQNQLSRG
jgi:hypothetical protein